METANQPDPAAAATEPGAPPAAPEVDLTGQVLGEFRILHRLGRGGMGEVYLAEQVALKRKVALKLLHPDMATNERSLSRFKAEAENVARATHANIVQIYTIGQTNGLNYIALEYVEGKNLREFLEKKGTPELSLGLHIMAQVASALQRASELGVIHRDVKPENIMLTKKWEVKVADFGLSRCFEEGSVQNLTQSQVVMGTPLYMSPEQVERRTIDSRTDIYSFGVTCYHMFAGQPPFRGNSPVDVAYHHVHTEPPPLCEVRPDLPTDLCTLIHKMMAKKPEERYQSAREILRDINRLRESLNLGAIAAISMSASFVGASPSDGLREAPTQTWPVEVSGPSIWRRLVIVASVIIALGGGLALGLYQQQRNAMLKDSPLPPDDRGPVKALFNAKEREKELQKLVQEHLQQYASAGLKHSIELGLFYLKERKYDDADQFFLDLAKESKSASYKRFGRIGHAVVLAFKDDFETSNAEFLAVMADIEKMEPRPKKTSKDEYEEYKLLWRDNVPMREMVAKALNHNHANAPMDFPEKLAAYRYPPRPTLKAP